MSPRNHCDSRGSLLFHCPRSRASGPARQPPTNITVKQSFGGGSSHQPNLSSSFETRQAILQFLSPPPGEFSANINAVLPLARAHIARCVRGRELDILVALIGPHDNPGSALTAQPGRSHGRPATNTSSRLIVQIGLPTDMLAGV